MPKFDRPLEQACVSNKNDKQNCQNYLSCTCRTSFSIVFMVFCAHYYAKDNLPKGTGASFHKQTKALKNTFLTLVQTFAILAMPPGADCIIDILGVFVRSKLSYTNETQIRSSQKRLPYTCQTSFFMVFTSVLCTLPFKAFECRKTIKTSKIASGAGKSATF